MTVIAWDGKTLSADRQVTNGMTRLSTTKIFKVFQHYKPFLVAITGDATIGMELIEWFKEGAEPDKYPSKNSENLASLIVIDKDENGGVISVYKYERTGYPYQYQGKFWAFGCSDESAMVAMELGASSAKAVELCSKYNTGCGCGVDTLEF